ncbi:MAG: GPW/gp25 family protein [Chloroflexi bacterium]|nr:GPW/gp25 family protein [Chloroflexota bacterium]
MSGDYREREFLGRGVAFPLQLSARGGVALVEGERDIEQSIRIILGTKPGERVMRPEFGCRVHELLFEPRSASTETRMHRYVLDALKRWEPRIDVISVNVYADADVDGALLAEVSYVIKATHDERSIVYPFFIVGQEEW